MNRADCSQSQELWIEALYREIDPADSAWLDQHLTGCPECRRQFDEMKDTFVTMGKKERVEPSQEYWDQYWTRLAPKLQPAQTPVIPFYRRISVSAYRVAAAILLVLLGVIIGRHYVPSTPVIVQQKQPGISVPVQETALDARTNRFLERSQVLILGLIHNEQPGSAVELDVPRKVSSELIQEASTLKTELANHKRKQLKRLVTDLEFILIQIANLESENDFSEIELLKSGVDQKGILLKIKMEQMRLGAVEESKPKSVTEKSL